MANGKKYTKEEKKEFFKQLRKRWTEAKRRLTDGEIKAIEAIVATHGLKVSATGFMFVSIQMKRQGFEGLPYLDAKTYQGWKDNGFRVRKGEHSTLSGITWVNPTAKNEDGEEELSDYVFPKIYHLFHRSQVDAA